MDEFAWAGWMGVVVTGDRKTPCMSCEMVFVIVGWLSAKRSSSHGAIWNTFDQGPVGLGKSIPSMEGATSAGKTSK